MFSPSWRRKLLEEIYCILIKLPASACKQFLCAKHLPLEMDQCCHWNSRHFYLRTEGCLFCHLGSWTEYVFTLRLMSQLHSLCDSGKHVHCCIVADWSVLSSETIFV